MTYILVINAGSSSLKYQLIDIDTESVIAKGICERIGIAGSQLTYSPANGEKVVKQQDMRNHEDAISLVLDILADKDVGVIKDMSSIAAVGHRVLHGGEKYSEPVLVDDKVLEAIEECIPLGPLHNPANLMGIRGCMAVMPGVPMVAVFDTAWGQAMEPKAYMYGTPYADYEEFKVRRYGFHGTSHRYVTGRAIEWLKKAGIPKEQARVITCHLGNGSSVSCSKGGKCVDTSMGLTPLEGPPMGTRCGSIDPAIVPFIMEKRNLTPAEMDTYMNKKSGMLGISGVSSDFRDLDAARKAGNEKAALALDMFAYKVKQYIGAYAAVLNGVDAIVFTAGVGENDRTMRQMIIENLDYLGVKVDFDYNLSCPRGEEVELSTPDSKVRVYVIPTDEEMTIAHDTAALAL
ncbi:MAG: acetate kinase [Clostridiales bacterium]|nr:acetate kinase [Clostridiales bacterium]